MYKSLKKLLKHSLSVALHYTFVDRKQWMKLLYLLISNICQLNKCQHIPPLLIVSCELVDFGIWFEVYN